MAKKSVGRHGAIPFRESDFAGMPQQERADLSGSLNQLSQQLAATRKMLQEMGGHGASAGQGSQDTLFSGCNNRQGHSIDDDTASPM